MKSVRWIFILLCCLNTSSVFLSQNADIDLLKKINQQYTPNGGRFMRILTDSDTPVALGIPTGFLIAGAIEHNPVFVFNAFESFTAQIFNGAITSALKWGIDRERPFNTYPDEIQKYAPAGSPSFPSGHTSMAFAMATSISLQYPKWYVIAPAYLYALGVGYSRMYLGVHYPSDVLVGAFLGSGSAVAAYYTFKWIKRKWVVKKASEHLQL